ncbi:acyltransferase family-domain-containing protein [Hyaloraphidium curvatum]|nr:acyltransferase family-domain-containing protein [Hyaloraphidium curvatum]
MPSPGAAPPASAADRSDSSTANESETDNASQSTANSRGLYADGDSPNADPGLPRPLDRWGTQATMLDGRGAAAPAPTGSPAKASPSKGSPAQASPSPHGSFMDEGDAIMLASLRPPDLEGQDAKAAGDAKPPLVTVPTLEESVPRDSTSPVITNPAKKKKLLYLEGIRGVAALVVAVHHYKQATFRDVGFWWAEESFHRYLWHLFWDGTFSVTVFYVLSGRVLTAAFFAKKGPMKALSSAVIRRPFRLGVPIAMMMAVNLILGAMGAYNMTDQAGRVMHSEMWLDNANNWNLIKNAGDYFIMLVNMFQMPFKVLPVPSVYPCGVIWTIPVEYLGSMFVYLVSFMMVHIPQNRYWIYFVLWFCLWWQMDWNGVFLLGLVITDLSTEGYLEKWRNWKYIWIVQILLFAIFLLMLTVEPVNAAIDRWTLSWQIQYGQLGGEAPWNEPKTTLIVAALCEILLIELSTSLQWFFSTWPFVMLGKYSFGIYLVHGLVLFAVNTWIWVGLFNAGLTYWGIVVVGFIPYILLVFFASWLFYYAFDKPAIALGQAVYRWGFVEELTWPNVKKGLGEYAEGWRAWGRERAEEWHSFWAWLGSCGKKKEQTL